MPSRPLPHDTYYYYLFAIFVILLVSIWLSYPPPRAALAYDGQGLMAVNRINDTAATAGTPFGAFTVRQYGVLRIAFHPSAGSADSTLILEVTTGGNTEAVTFNAGTAIGNGEGWTGVWPVYPGYTYEWDVGTTTRVNLHTEVVYGGGF